MNRLARAFLGVLLIALVSSCRQGRSAVQERSDPPAFLADVESWVTTSSVTKRTYQISVALPGGYEKQYQPYPVVYSVDANAQFGTLVETVRVLRYDKLVPDVVVVGIGYPNRGQGFMASYAARAFDLTPTADQAWVKEHRANKELYRELQELGWPAPESSGGGAEFLRFLREELIPSIEKCGN